MKIKGTTDTIILIKWGFEKGSQVYVGQKIDEVEEPFEKTERD